MRGNFRKAMTLAAFTVEHECFITSADKRVSPAPSDLAARVEQPLPTADKGTVPAAASSTAKQDLKPTVEQEIEALKSRIDPLESEVKQAKVAALADSNDTAALKAAEKSLVASSGAVPASTGVANLDHARIQLVHCRAGTRTHVCSRTARRPRRSAPRQRRKGEPFEGDWTWLNSNGHAVDSPIATKYFTPEFRADANYTLDYNHPHDDSLGGSTETFRSDEWQLEQISIGGDIHIDNVRGRILTMEMDSFATTTAA